MSDFNDNQRQHVRITFQHIDELMSEVVRVLDPADAQSPFARHVPDASPVQRRVMADYAVRIRATMRQALEANDVTLPPPHISAVWAARIALTSADIAVEELKPAHMRGYGELSEKAKNELDLIASEIGDLLHRMDAFLAQGSTRDALARLDRLEKTTDEARILRELGRMITVHGLIRCRLTLDMLVDRLESKTFEVALFGRVSSGKSSLLDYILQTDLLPVGVTPVTAIPTRVTYGPSARAVIGFAESPRLVIDPHLLAEYATEQQNPANAKHVTRIDLELPTSRLQEGITFVDTPGLGSLAASGAAESLAYLPHCDLGIVLVDASSTIIPEDIAVVNALYHAGADAIVLLTKVDMLAPQDRERAVGYAATQLYANLGIAVPVHPVSVKGESSKLCDEWVDQDLIPRLQAHRKLAAASLHRKVFGLRDAVLDELKRRRRRMEGRIEQQPSGREDAGARRKVEALAHLDNAKGGHIAVLEDTTAVINEIVDDVANHLAARWRENHATDAEITGAIATTIEKHSTTIATDLSRELIALRQFLAEALSSARNDRRADGDDDLPKLIDMPVLATTSIVAHVHVRKPVLGFMGTHVLRHGARKQLEDQLAPRLKEAFYRYGKRLDDWRSHAILELRRAFTAQSELSQAGRDEEPKNRAGQDTAGFDEIERDIRALEQLMQPMLPVG
jgi:GTP-binding protein EngB required for normal cell division